MPGWPAVPALSPWTLLAEWRVCGGLSEVLIQFSHIWTSTLSCHINETLFFSSLCLSPRGFPQGDVCQPCAPECASCHGNSSHCLSCEKQYMLQDHSCRSHCLEGYYATGRECRHCPAHCRECNQDGICNSKTANYFMIACMSKNLVLVQRHCNTVFDAD